MASSRQGSSSPFNRQASHRSPSGGLPYPSPLRPSSWAASPAYQPGHLPLSASGSNLSRHASPFAAGSSPPHQQPQVQPWGLPRPGSGVSAGPFGLPHFAQLPAWPPHRPDSRGSAATTANGRPWSAGGQQSVGMEEWPKEWGWTGVDIPVHGVKALKEEVERSKETTVEGSESEDGTGAGGDLGVGGSQTATTTSDDDEGQTEVVSYSFGADRWKVELVRAGPRSSIPSTPTTSFTTSLFPPIVPPRSAETLLSGSSPVPSDPNALSLFLTCHALEVDWPTVRSLSAALFVGVRPMSVTTTSSTVGGETAGLGGPAGGDDEGWIWKTWVDERSFEREREVWECHPFPSLSSLLSHPQIAEQDGFVLRVQVASPSTLSPPVIRGGGWVPSSLMLGVSNLFDDPLTADVRIIVAEREMPAPQADDLSETDVTASPPSGLHTPRAAQTASAPKLPRYRKRVLYAHSGIMKARSEYFAAMLGNDGGTGWAETAEGSSGPTSEGGRKMHTIRIEDFDFTTTYWLLRWIYTNQMAFLPSEDVRACPPHEGSDLPAGWLTSTSIGTVPPTHFAGPSRPRGSPSSTSFSAIRQFHEDPWGWKTFLHHLPGGGPQSPPLHHPSSYHYRTGSSDGGTSDTFSHLETVSEGGGVFGPTGAHGPSGKRVASGPVPPRGMATRRPTGPVRPVPSTSGTTSTTTTTKPTEKKRTSSPAAAAGTDSATPTTPGPSSSSSSPTVTEEPEGRVSPLQSFAAAYAASTSPMAGLPSVRKPTAGVPAAGSTAKGGAVSGRATPAVSATTTTPGITTKTATATKSASAPQAAGASARSTGRTTPSGKSERGGAGGNGLMRDPHAHPAAVTDKASALAMYRLAHRYRLEPLMDLSLSHLTSSLTPTTAFPLLLSTHHFPQLHAEIRGYCLANCWRIVGEGEVERCFQEVGEGMWDNGGEVLLSFTMSLMPTPFGAATAAGLMSAPGPNATAGWPNPASSSGAAGATTGV